MTGPMPVWEESQFEGPNGNPAAPLTPGMHLRADQERTGIRPPNAP